MKEKDDMEAAKRLMNIDELSAYLGVNRNTIYWWIAMRKIPHSKLGKLVRFDQSEINTWLDSKSRKVASSI